MTGAEKITGRILQEAREKARQIREEWEDKASAIRERTAREAQEERTRILEKARLEGEERKRRIRTVAELEMRKSLLAVKQDMIEEAFNGVLEQLCGMKVEDYQNTIWTLMMDAVHRGDEEIIIAPRDEDKFTPDFMDRINRQLVQSGKMGQVRLAEERRDIRGGFILKSGGIEINSSFEAILRMERDEMEPDVVRVLFGP